MNPVIKSTTTAPAPTQRDILSALQSFRAFYESGQGYSTLGRATFAALCGKITQREGACIVLRSRYVGRRAAMALAEPARQTVTPPAEPVWDGPAPLYTPPARRLGGNVRVKKPSK